MNEVTCLELSVLFWIAHVLCQAFTAHGEFGSAYLLGPRDGKIAVKGVLHGRATRALNNYMENLVPFVGLDVALIATQHAGGWGPTIWILGRIAYLPLYLLGVSFARSGAWAVALVGLLMMLARLAGH